jgi:hypothetical protein
MSLLQSWKAFFADYERVYERRQLLDRPWEEDFLHFALDGTVHGFVAPPEDGRRRSVTADGWCPCWARQQHRGG